MGYSFSVEKLRSPVFSTYPQVQFIQSVVNLFVIVWEKYRFSIPKDYYATRLPQTDPLAGSPSTVYSVVYWSEIVSSKEMRASENTRPNFPTSRPAVHGEQPGNVSEVSVMWLTLAHISSSQWTSGGTFGLPLINRLLPQRGLSLREMFWSNSWLGCKHMSCFLESIVVGFL